ncbi:MULTISPECIES: (deoxy)nucleoside triphosphate pyrophosphohydrolase [Mycolicibacter]|uniref:8-oxo-dGTP diphosphatase n=1 Tax=Mycolicibacter virginiensis TaxID=1795032 RepID=A0A9X7IR62_9MYCO|nr:MULTISPECIES: (deoxy)nucleoside triphosphate pyrophosphohydrolase [Mycobacteriaceae]OBG39638.1 DNA mismatch repair protein MutT [Mycolicibacter heraklionensis]PQM53867.1 (deoxy)nucleoside triphosphate pyrophosphohydrolase [Mycolicibacter virginiensis]ULP48753.1 (deoxy)nucleoside triphosphate pyrophosphohydrolase [Mycolicibacter virginiensis]
MSPQIVVAGAVLAESAAGRTVLIAQRRRPPELAGRWELPGGKVMPGESESAALARELGEELGLDAGAIMVGERLGADVPLNPQMLLRAYLVRLTSGEPQPHDHQALRWVTAVQLTDVDWVPADRAWLPELAQALW